MLKTRNKYSLVFLLLFIFLFPCHVAALPSGTEPGHSDLSEMSADIKLKVHSDDDDFKTSFEGNIEKIRAANIDEDGILYGGHKGARHFYENETGQGYLGIFQNAKDRANSIYNAELRIYCSSNDDARAWKFLGHVQHLLQDMTSPAHSTGSSHITGDPFESFVDDNWEAWSPEMLLGYEYNPVINDFVEVRGPLPDESKIRNPKTGEFFSGLKEYVEYERDNNPYNPDKHQLNFISSYFDVLSSNSYEHYYSLDDLKHKKSETRIIVNWAPIAQASKELLPMALMYGAGLIDTLWNDMQKVKSDPGYKGKYCINISEPAGDGPDDRFDVSNAYFYEDILNLDIDEMAKLNFRTSVKKGKIGALYYLHAIDSYKQSMAANTDKEIEAADARYNELAEVTIPNSAKFMNDRITSPDLVLFEQGHYEANTSLMLRFKELVVTKDEEFNPSIVKDHPVFIIPSGGLFGLENSSILKVSLDEYVRQGGTLIVFAQQHGYEFSILPVPQEADGTFKTITGYGWREDQACFTNGTYIDTWHQVLSGQSRSTPTVNVDGYFSSYPSNSKVLLRRTANGQPAMLMYEHGAGRVIVTSMYSDWAYGHSQASQEEIALVRDMITWAKAPAFQAHTAPENHLKIV